MISKTPALNEKLLLKANIGNSNTADLQLHYFVALGKASLNINLSVSYKKERYIYNIYTACK